MANQDDTPLISGKQLTIINIIQLLWFVSSKMAIVLQLWVKQAVFLILGIVLKFELFEVTYRSFWIPQCVEINEHY